MSIRYTCIHSHAHIHVYSYILSLKTGPFCKAIIRNTYGHKCTVCRKVENSCTQQKIIVRLVLKTALVTVAVCGFVADTHFDTFVWLQYQFRASQFPHSTVS